MHTLSYLNNDRKVLPVNFLTFMLHTSWWFCKSLKLDGAKSKFTLPKYWRVELSILFKSSLSLMNSTTHIFLFVLKLIWLWAFALSSLQRQRGRISGRVRRLACFVRCFTLSFCSHKTPWTWEKTNYSFRHRCPSAFSSLSRPPGHITCVPQGWLWHGSCHCWGPWGPGCCSEQGGLLSLMDCPPEHGALNLERVRTQHPWPLTPNPVTPWLCYHL